MGAVERADLENEAADRAGQPGPDLLRNSGADALQKVLNDTVEADKKSLGTRCGPLRDRH